MVPDAAGLRTRSRLRFRSRPLYWNDNRSGKNVKGRTKIFSEAQSDQDSISISFSSPSTTEKISHKSAIGKSETNFFRIFGGDTGFSIRKFSGFFGETGTAFAFNSFNRAAQVKLT